MILLKDKTMTQNSAHHFYHKFLFPIAAGQTLAQLLLWCFLGPIHTFLTQSYLLTNPEARSYIRRAIRNFILYIDPSKKIRILVSKPLAT